MAASTMQANVNMQSIPTPRDLHRVLHDPLPPFLAALMALCENVRCRLEGICNFGGDPVSHGTSAGCMP
jgi:hypothetical protein